LENLGSDPNIRYTGKKEKVNLIELEKTVAEKIAAAEVSLKKMKQVWLTSCSVY
jgi:hypothetical protein